MRDSSGNFFHFGVPGRLMYPAGAQKARTAACRPVGLGAAVLLGGAKREQMLSDYDEVHRILGDSHAPDEAARIMIELLNKK